MPQIRDLFNHKSSYAKVALLIDFRREQHTEYFMSKLITLSWLKLLLQVKLLLKLF